jgi:hypothetical protein
MFRSSIAVLTVAVLCSASCGQAQETRESVLRRDSGESAAQFAKRVIPEGTELAFAPVEIAVGPPGPSVVLLFRDADSLSNHTGWVLHPAGGDGIYRKAVLPPMDEAPGLFDITVKSVFAVDRARGPELIVLYEYYRAGSGTDPAHAAYVHTWTGASFDVDTKSSSSVVGLDTEGAVRSKLATTLQ